MKKLISLLALVAFLVATPAQATLYGYYKEQGQSLPSIGERSLIYSEISDDTYYGTAEQNNLLESYLRDGYFGGMLGATTKFKLTDSRSFTPYATSTPTADLIPIADGDGKLDDGWLSTNALDKTKLQKSFTAGENIIAGNAVIMGNAVNYIAGTAEYVSGASGDSNITDTVWYARAITTSDNARYIKTVKIKDGNSTLRTITFTDPVPVSPSTNYSVVFRTAGGGHTTLIASIRTGQATSIGSSDIGGITATTTIDGNQWTSGGSWTNVGTVNGAGSKSTNSGSSWSSIGGNVGNAGGSGVEFQVEELNTEAGKIYKADASLNNEFANNFIGFATESFNTDETGYVALTGIDTQSGLTTGYTYYLSNTSGAIATSAGSQSRKVGLAISATELLIKHDNP